MGLFRFSTQSIDEWTIYPWIHSNCNSLSDEDQLRPVSIPDILPARYCLDLWMAFARDTFKFACLYYYVLVTICLVCIILFTELTG